MYFLVIAICASVAVSLLLKLVRKTKIEIAQIVFWNYIAAALIAYFFLDYNNIDAKSIILKSNLYLFFALGLLLPSVFIFMGKAVQSSGVAKADTANRLSLILGIIASFVLFGQALNYITIGAIILAFIALLMLLNKPKVPLRLDFKSQEQHTAVWLFLVWLGYGVIDIIFKIMAVKNTIALLGGVFVLAAILMFIYLLLTRTKFNFSSLLVGLLLGCLNFTNIYTYIRAHQELHQETAFVFTTMNIGVIILSLVAGIIFFREKLTKINLLGIVISLFAIFALYYGSRLI
ncbi:hypothetical protein CJP74_04895 [Psittacicella melopsittaci]|uniref:EamA domain-containing protein n=1 Tax=Psittacicella melopsittaci TaxID=2028576 RepID=A0A3A1Y4Z1_9GAMM|nr:DMT family transporter [Psittacicella melopsittaci]RIY32336.1 hypothetical protein CJP74_04895 [Psittacicella melopsittaci]